MTRVVVKLRENILPFFIIIFSTLLLTFFHHTVSKDASIIHLSHYYGFYVIVIYSAYVFGLRGGLLTALCISIIYDYRVYTHIFPFEHFLIRSYVEVSMMFAVGAIAGYFSSKLRKSMELLRLETEHKLELEKKLAHDDRLRVLGQLSAGLAHEIRNPLAAIKSGVDILNKKGLDQKVLNIVTGEVDRLDEFMSNFLKYVRIGKSKDEVFSAFDLFEEVSELVNLMVKNNQEIVFIARNNFLKTDMLRGDKNSLKQAMLNILTNSVEKLTGSGGEVNFFATAGSGKCFFDITDNGASPDKDILKYIFEPFFTTKPDGTGLGLSISSKIIAEHCGLITYDDSDGVKFIITLEAYDKNTSN
jgi:signal transduction histidine kinase